MSAAWQEEFLSGKVLLVNKPLQWTSFDVVKKIRSLIGVSKVGHAGTLDPLATGLLIVCTGKFTKSINDFMAKEKEYTGTITLGSVTPSFDLETEPEQIKPIDYLDNTHLQAAIQPFLGEIEQMPPIFSALKKNGQAAYINARKGIEVKLDPRRVTIHEFQIPFVELPKVHFKIICSTGTYIRSIANDYGAALGCGGHLSSLCRTRIGQFDLKDAITITDFEANINQLKATN
jgi:tRNA pseudouridine55 synthase